MKREVRDKKEELYFKASRLRGLQFTEGMKYDNNKKIRDDQDKCYKKYVFFKNMLKADEKVKHK